MISLRTAALCLLAMLVAVPLSSEAGTPLGVATPIVDPGHKGLSRWFSALKQAQNKQGVARALHYGDSTLAGDGLSRTVRARLAARFGDAGPGFVSASFTPKWSARVDVKSTRSGGWDWRTILLGGAGGRYGLGGIVGILSSGAKVTYSAVGSANTSSSATATAPAVPQKHVEVWYQAGAGYGSIWATADGKEILRTSAAASATEDRRFVVDLPAPASTFAFGASGGTVPVYGTVLETGQPGTTWEALGVIGVGSKSFSSYAKDGLPAQMAQRKPDLVVVMLGGNEAGYPALMSKNGSAYLPIYEGALKTILAGSGGASCLVMTPLDQGYYEVPEGAAPAEGAEVVEGAEAAPPPKGEAKARPGMANLVAAQQQAATNAGCAFWSTWAAMGGQGSALVWARTRGMGTGDLVHLSPLGLDRIGNLLADALLADYDAWNAGR